MLLLLFLRAGGSLRGKGWKFGSGFVDGIFPVLSPTAEKILEYLQKEVDTERIWGSLDKLPPSLDAWDDVLSVSVQLRMRKHWDSIISVRNPYIHTYIYVRARSLTSSQWAPTQTQHWHVDTNNNLRKYKWLNVTTRVGVVLVSYTNMYRTRSTSSIWSAT